MFQTIDNPLLLDEPLVLAVGCDAATCQVLKAALRKFAVDCYATLEELLDAFEPTRRGCVFLDLDRVALGPGEAIRRLAERGMCLPVVFLAPHGEDADGDLPKATCAVREGAYDFLPQPWLPRRLARIAGEALQWEEARHPEIVERAQIERRLARLTDNERQMLELMVRGTPTKEIASLLRLSTRAVETRRRIIVEKMRAKNPADLIRQAVTAGVGRSSEGGNHEVVVPTC